MPVSELSQGGIQKVNLKFVGWIVELAGVALWFYGYSVAGHPPLIDWESNAPWWIADWLPNLEAEMGMLLILIAMIPLYWPQRR